MKSIYYIIIVLGLPYGWSWLGLNKALFMTILDVGQGINKGLKTNV